MTEITPDEQEEIQWVVVAETLGLTQAQILAGHLESAGIPVYVWQEGAGRAIGITVGALGTGYVQVPEEYRDKALELLEATDEDDYGEEYDYEQTDEEE